MDAIIIALPLPVLWKLQLRLKQKVLLAGLFALGFFVTVALTVKIRMTWITVTKKPRANRPARRTFCLRRSWSFHYCDLVLCGDQPGRELIFDISSSLSKTNENVQVVPVPWRTELSA
jgi:hypothetical protein